MTGSNKDQGDQEFDEYWSWVKGIVSNYAIECAIKFRILQDTIHGKDDIVKFEELDSESCLGLTIGEVSKGTFKLSLRETSNKIIHAKRVVPQWVVSKTNNKKFKYWSGEVELCGERGSEQWKIMLNIAIWAQAMQQFLKSLVILMLHIMLAKIGTKPYIKINFSCYIRWMQKSSTGY